MSMKGIKRSYFPERNTNNIAVQVIYPGASPEEVEQGITLKIENAVKSLEKVEEVNSTSSENVAIVVIGRKQRFSIDEMLTDVKNAIDQINSFPEGAEKPIVFKLLPKNTVMQLTLSSNADILDLRDLAIKVKNDFLNSRVISQLKMDGMPEVEMAVEVHKMELDRYQMTINEIVDAIKFSNVDVSGGTIKTGKEELLIRSKGKELDAEHIENIVVRTTSSAGILKIKDLADVRFQLAESPNKRYFNGQRAIGFTIEKLAEEDIILITDYLKEYITQFNKLNPEAQIDIIEDSSIPLNEQLKILTENGVMGLVLVMISLGIFLNLRLAFWVAMGIPVSFLGMIIVGYIMGVTINQISLFGMILVIGILVDDGIVISENVYMHLEKGKSPLRAAVDGLMEVLPSVFISVFTTIIAFVGLFFIEGYIGDFIKEIAIIVIACLTVSLLEAMFILPAHLSSKSTLGKQTRFIIAVNQGVNYVKNKLYSRALRFVIHWRTLIALSVPIITFGLIIGLIQGGQLNFSLFPFLDSDKLTLELVMQQGTDEQITEQRLQRCEAAIWRVNEQIKKEREDTSNIIISTSLAVGGNSIETGGHAGEIVIKLQNEAERNYSSKFISAKIREEIGDIEDVTKFALEGKTFFGKPVVIGLMSPNTKELYAAKDELKAQLKALPELKDVIDNDIEGKKELNITLKPKAKYLGLTIGDVSLQVRNAFFGKEAQRIQRNEDDVKIVVRYPKEDRASFSDLNSMQIVTPTGLKVPFREIASYEIERGIVTIAHHAGQREIKIEASQVDPDKSLDNLLEKINTEILPPILDKYSSISIVKGGQEREQQKFNDSKNRVIIIVVICIYLVMSLAFRSWSQPIIILIMIPFGVASAYLGHFIHDQSIVIMSQFGLIGLCGVIINDAVVFLDKYNTQIRLGQSVKQAVYNAGKSRFRAIMLTSITTVVGLYPLIFEKSNEAKFLVPMAISLTYGVMFGTFFVLLYFPTLILTLNDAKRWFWSYWEGYKIKSEKAEPAYRESIRLKEQAEEKR